MLASRGAELVDAVAERIRRGYIRDMSKNKPTPWDDRAKARIASRVAQDPTSPSAKSQLDRKSQSGADKNAQQGGQGKSGN